MTTNHVPVGPVAALMLPKTNLALIALAKAIHDAMLDNPSFPRPNPPLAVLAADIAAMEEAEMKAASRTKGAASLRDAKKRRLKDVLFHLQDYVQSVVETNTSDGAAIIHSAFMSVRKVPRREFPDVSAKDGEVSGKVKLAARAVAPVATYGWEYSLDQSTWIPLPETMRARTELAGLTPARTYYFRFRALTRAGWGDYSQIVSLLVR